eukprot:TRINITY_DN1294_c0_g1_i1.p1 TRINITY_DN1294_c0_g1~~TRINITY_DN1294_c0_g1_i1.p1  ORF type:complete len:1304 (+),score=409.93 TRINITY_DN1294_c0_g1_i1:92-4003(+)
MPSHDMEMSNIPDPNARPPATNPPLPQLPNKSDFRGLNTGLTYEEIVAKELKVTNAIVDHPKKLMGVCVVIFIVLTAIVFGVVGLKIDEDKMQSMTDIRTRKVSSVTALQNYLETHSFHDTPPPPGQPTHRYRSEPLGGIWVMYEAQGHGNILSLDNLKKMKAAEDRIYLTDDWKYYCKASWIRADQGCPGGWGCPWYRNEWDVTRTSKMVDGSSLVCDPPLGSLPWILWNTRMANKITREECDLVNNFTGCVEDDDVVPMLLTALNSTEHASAQASLNNGGVAPTQVQVDAFLRSVGRLLKDPSWARLKLFFDKTFNSEDKAAADPSRYTAKVIRSLHTFGGPVSKVDPKGVASKHSGKQCWSFRTEGSCKAVRGCEWSKFAGFFRNETGCMFEQYPVVFAGAADSDDNQDQQEDVAEWYLKDLSDYLDDAGTDSYDVLYFMDGVLWDKFMEILARDALLALISFSFVYLYLQIHTGSFFLASLGMFQVIMPMPIGYFIYRVVFQITVFNGLSTLSLFIVLAIGADDIFVFMDKWVQADVRPRSDNCCYLKGRMAECWKGAGSAMLITSITTMAAFLATSTSPIIQIKTFGIFAAILVFLDYALVMTFFACAVVVYHRGFEGTVGCMAMGTQCCGAWCSCCTCYTTMHSTAPEALGCCGTYLSQARSYETIEEAKAALGDRLDFSPGQPGNPVPSAAAVTAPKPGAGDVDYSTDKEYRRRILAFRVLLSLSVFIMTLSFVLLKLSRDSEEGFRGLVLLGVLGLGMFTGAMNCLWAANGRKSELDGTSGSSESVLHGTVAPFLSGTHKNPTVNKCRFIPGVLLVVLWVVFITRAVKLSHTTKADEFLPDWHPIQRGFSLYTDAFPTSPDDYVQKVFVTWGISQDDPEDRGHLSMWSSKIGRANYDNGGDKQAVLTDPKFQTFVSRFCDETVRRAEETKLVQRRLLTTRTNSTLGAGDVNCFMHGFDRWVKAEKGREFPVPANEFTRLLHEFLKAQYKKAKDEYEYLEPYEVYYDKVKFRYADGGTTLPTGIDAMYVHFNTTLKFWGQPNGLLRDWYGSWNDWVEAIENREPAWVQEIYPSSLPFAPQWFHASEAWVRMRTQEFLVQGALIGTLVSLGLACLIIFLGTLNILMAFLVLLELIGVVGFVLGVIELSGWELGLIESVAITILVGLAVDYVVHFAIHYDHCSVVSAEDAAARGDASTERQRRVFEVVSSMGPTVLGGAATSAGAAVILLCTWIQFFNKFGICFLLTIVFSYVWSMFFFLPLLSVVGPQDDFLSLKPVVKRCFQRKSEAKYPTDTDAA